MDVHPFFMLCRRWDLVTKLPRVARSSFATPIQVPTHDKQLSCSLDTIKLFHYFLCRGWDLNPHTLRYTILSRARLPFRHPGNYKFKLFICSLPAPDLRYFSLILAVLLSGHSSVYINLSGRYFLVVVEYPELCSERCLSILVVIPTY